MIVVMILIVVPTFATWMLVLVFVMLRPDDPLAAELVEILATVLHVAVSKMLDRMRLRRVLIMAAHFAVAENAEVILEMKTIRTAQSCNLITVVPCHEMISKPLRLQMFQKCSQFSIGPERADDIRLAAAVPGIDKTHFEERIAEVGVVRINFLPNAIFYPPPSLARIWEL